LDGTDRKRSQQRFEVTPEIDADNSERTMPSARIQITDIEIFFTVFID
jgi:hypothetical protein